MVKYRFKTEQEFKAGGLWDYKLESPNGWNFRGGMNKYLGQDIPEEYNQKCSKNQGFDLDEWFFGNEDYVLKEKETLKFKKDKWYKWYQKNHGNFHYGKFDSITDTTIIMKPWIMHCDSYKEIGSFDINNAEQITEVSYSEIEQFLPEDMKETKDFPKKWKIKMTPEVGKYYDLRCNSTCYTNCKRPYITSHNYCNEYIASNKLNGTILASFYDQNLEDFEEITIEQFRKYILKQSVEEEFVLPEKWYTKPKTNEEKDILNKFVVDLKDNHWKIEDKHSYKHTPHFKNGNYQRSTWIGCEDNDYTEITFEQFKKYVLKDKSVASTDKVKYVIATSEEAVFVSSVVESVSISILNVEDSKILPLPKSIESIKTKLN